MAAPFYVNEGFENVDAFDSQRGFEPAKRRSTERVARRWAAQQCRRKTLGRSPTNPVGRPISTSRLAWVKISGGPRTKEKSVLHLRNARTFP